MFVIVRVVVCSGQWTGGCVTCRLTFGQEILCCCGIVGNVSQRAKESLGTLAQPRGRPRSPESATQLTGCARDRCLGAGADTRMVSGQRDRDRVGGCMRVQSGQQLGVRSRKTNIWQQQMIVCRHAREQGSGALKGSCVSSAVAGVGVSKFGPIT